jgi:hypothetical protein
MKLNTAAIVTRRERLSCALCSRTCVRSDLQSVAMRLMMGSRCKALQRQNCE